MSDAGTLRKRILFTSFVLGVLGGICGYLAFKAVANGNLVLLAVVPAVLLASVPMIKSLRELVRERREAVAAGRGDQSMATQP